MIAKLIYIFVCISGLFLSTATKAELVVRQSTALSGVLASSGVPMAKGAEVYFAELNAKGGVAGQKIKFISTDDEYKVNKTVANAESACRDENTVVMMGGSGTANNEALFTQKVLASCELALVGPRTGALSLRDASNAYMFHVRPTYAEEVQKIIKHFETTGLKKIGIVYQDDAFGQDGLVAAQNAIKDLRLSAVLTVAYPRNTADVKQAVDKALVLNPDAILLLTTTASTAAFIQAYRSAAGAAYLAGLSINDVSSIVKKVGDGYARGVVIAMPFPDLYKARTTIAKQYLAALQRYAPNEKPSYPGLEGYVVAKAIGYALAKASKPNRQSVYKALQGMSDVNLGDFYLNYSSTTRSGSHYVDIGVINKDGILYR